MGLACQASLSITNSQSLLILMSIELVMSSNHLILCPPLLLSPSREERKEELLEAMHLREPRAINKANVYKALESQAGIKTTSEPFFRMETYASQVLNEVLVLVYLLSP